MKYKGEEIPDECRSLVLILEKVQPDVDGKENGIDLLFRMNHAKTLSELNKSYADLLKFVEKYCVVYDNDYENTKQKHNALNGMYAMLKKKNADISKTFSYKSYVVSPTPKQGNNEITASSDYSSYRSRKETSNSNVENDTSSIWGIIVLIIIAIPLLMLGPIGIGVIIWVVCMCLGRLTGREK